MKEEPQATDDLVLTNLAQQIGNGRSRIRIKPSSKNSSTISIIGFFANATPPKPSQPEGCAPSLTKRCD